MSANAVYPVWVVPRIMVRFLGMDTIYFSIGTLFRYTLEVAMSRILKATAIYAGYAAAAFFIGAAIVGCVINYLLPYL